MLATLFAFTLLGQSPGYTIKVTGDPVEGMEKQVAKHVDTGMETVSKFFGTRFPSAFEVEIFANRAALDKAIKDRWNMPPTEKWMVASGGSANLFVLSPRVWKIEATGHDGDDPKHVQEIVTHELTHVYHGQVCPKKDFDGMEKSAWFIEGLATYVAGQLEGRHNSAEQAIRSGKAPKTLEAAWSGDFRYGVAGSMVRYVDRKYGRSKLIGLLKLGDNAAILKSLGVTETQFMKGWLASVK